MSRYRQLTTERLMAAVLFILLFAMAVRVPTDTDTWWHLRSGKVMVEQHAILRHDLFSHTRLDVAWVNHSWGAQLVLYGAYELFGDGVLPGDSGNIGLALVTALLATALRETQIPIVPIGGITAQTVKCQGHHGSTPNTRKATPRCEQAPCQQHHVASPRINRCVLRNRLDQIVRDLRPLGEKPRDRRLSRGRAGRVRP